MGRGPVRGIVAGAPATGVACSDGRSVVRTRPDGSFDIEPRGPHVFVCAPSGFAADPWFVPSDAELRFELVPQEQPVPFRFAQITDLHMALDGWVFGQPIVSTTDAVARLVDEVAEIVPDAAFIVSTGDQTNNGTDGEFGAYLSAIARSPMRIVSIPGNHDHNSVDVAKAKQDGARFGDGVYITPYDGFIGPRWFSFDHGGVHFVAIDWTTHHLGLEREVQEAWVRADLAHVDGATPVIFFTHDLMQSSFFDAIGRDPVASFSGHWHTTRVVEASGSLHVNTAPATFGGLDYSAPHWRIVTWDGRRISVESIRRGATTAPLPTSGERWSVALSGGAHRAGPVVAGDLVVAAFGDEDTPSGGIEAFDVSTGERRWVVRTGSAIKATPVLCGGRVVAAAVTGETVCVDVARGTELWRREIDDPLRLWTYLRPATDGRLVFVGDTARFVALDLDDGSVAWSRDDLGSRGNITCHSHPVVVDGVLMLSFAAQVPDMWAVDAATGVTRWPTGVRAASVYDLAPELLGVHLPKTPVSGFGRDPDVPDVYVVRLGNRLERIRVSDGEVVWTAEVAGWFNPATPLADGGDVFVCEGTGSLRCVARDDGALRWTTELTTSSPLAMGPYRDAGGVLLADPVVTPAGVIVACGDGHVLLVDRRDGQVVRDTDIGAPVVATPALHEDTCFVVGTDGVLRGLQDL